MRIPVVVKLQTGMVVPLKTWVMRTLFSVAAVGRMPGNPTRFPSNNPIACTRMCIFFGGGLAFLKPGLGNQGIVN
jgi:hypothetical protein